jgi:hypothetical protein
MTKWMTRLNWDIDTVVPMRDLESEGQGKDRADCMRRFEAAWSHCLC